MTIAQLKKRLDSLATKLSANLDKVDAAISGYEAVVSDLFTAIDDFIAQEETKKNG